VSPLNVSLSQAATHNLNYLYLLARANPVRFVFNDDVASFPTCAADVYLDFEDVQTSGVVRPPEPYAAAPATPFPSDLSAAKLRPSYSHSTREVPAVSTLI